jgi:hypothetical protein
MTIDTDDYRPICPKYLPYLNINALAGRPIPIHTFHDGNRWNLWLQTENGFLQPLRVEDCIETVYVALEPAHSSDAYFKFFNFIYKYVDNRTSLSFINALASDIFNIGTSLKKLDLFRSLGKDLGGRSRIVSTELEYLLVVCRSVFDLLQEIICRIWEDIKLTDPSIQKRKLTPSFSKMVLSGQDFISPQKIQEKYGLPPSLAIWYSECVPFFCELRDARDKIVHQPSGVPLIYIMDDSFSIGVDSVSSLFSKMIEWPKNALKNGTIGSLNYFIANFICKTLDACEKFAIAFTQEIVTLPDFTTNHNFFLRSHHMSSLIGINRVLEVDPWSDFTSPN